MSMDKMPTPSTLPFPQGDDRPDQQYHMRIARDGTWFYHGSPIGRIALVKLFSTVLKRDDAGDYWLVTPAERGRILVEDAPFLAVEMKAEGEGRDAALAFRLNTGELVAADADHALRFEQGEDGPRPYLHVRGGMEALVARPVYYDIAERALSGDDDPPGVWSNDAFFALEPDA